MTDAGDWRAGHQLKKIFNMCRFINDPDSSLFNLYLLCDGKSTFAKKKTSFEVTKVTEGFRKLNSSSQQVTGNRLHPPIAIRKDSNICCNRSDAWGTNWTNYPDPANLPNSQSTETQKMNSGLSRTKKYASNHYFLLLFCQML